MKKLFCLVLFFFIIAPMTHAQDNTVSAANPMIQYSGRIDFSDPLAPRFDWSGISITAAFHGTSIGFLLDDAGNNYNVIVDGQPNTVGPPAPVNPFTPWITSRPVIMWSKLLNEPSHFLVPRPLKAWSYPLAEPYPTPPPPQADASS